MRSRIIRGVVVSFAVAALVAGCGDDEESTTAAEAPGETTPAGTPGPPTASGEVPVEAREYAFDNVPETVEAGKTTFTLNNVGEEEHEMFVVKLAEDATFQEAIEAQGEEGTVEEEVGGIKPIAPGEEDDFEANLKAGNYGMVCALPGPEGQPHVVLGQAAEFVVE